MENQFWFLEYDVESNMEGHDFKTFIREVELYYDKNKKLWVNRDEYTGNWYPATFPCHSYRAAKRHLRKHNEIPKGTKLEIECVMEKISKLTFNTNKFSNIR